MDESHYAVYFVAAVVFFVLLFTFWFTYQDSHDALPDLPSAQETLALQQADNETAIRRRLPGGGTTFQNIMTGFTDKPMLYLGLAGSAAMVTVGAWFAREGTDKIKEMVWRPDLLYGFGVLLIGFWFLQHFLRGQSVLGVGKGNLGDPNFMQYSTKIVLVGSYLLLGSGGVLTMMRAPGVGDFKFLQDYSASGLFALGGIIFGTYILTQIIIPYIVNNLNGKHDYEMDRIPLAGFVGGAGLIAGMVLWAGYSTSDATKFASGLGVGISFTVVVTLFVWWVVRKGFDANLWVQGFWVLAPLTVGIWITVDMAHGAGSQAEIIKQMHGIPICILLIFAGGIVDYLFYRLNNNKSDLIAQIPVSVSFVGLGLAYIFHYVFQNGEVPPKPEAWAQAGLPIMAWVTGGLIFGILFKKFMNDNKDYKAKGVTHNIAYTFVISSTVFLGAIANMGSINSDKLLWKASNEYNIGLSLGLSLVLTSIMVWIICHCYTDEEGEVSFKAFLPILSVLSISTTFTTLAIGNGDQWEHTSHVAGTMGIVAGVIFGVWALYKLGGKCFS